MHFSQPSLPVTMAMANEGRHTAIPSPLDRMYAKYMEPDTLCRLPALSLQDLYILFRSDLFPAKLWHPVPIHKFFGSVLNMVSCLMYGLSLQLHETLALSHLYIYHPYFLFLYTYYNLFISFTCSHIKYNRFVHFISLRKYNLFISYNSLYINIITHDRLQIIFQQCIINFLHTSAIRNFKLIIAFVLDIFHMASDSGADSC